MCGYDYELHVVREYENIFALTDTETAGPYGDFPTFERCMRMQMNMLSHAHATGYFTMTARHILYWTVASDAAYAWQCKFGFTSPSKNGVPMFIDKTVENTVKSLCQWIGHTVRAGHDKRVRQVAFFLKELIDELQTRSIKDDGITPRSDFTQPLKQLEIDEAFWKSLETYRATDVARGKMINPLPAPGRKTRPPSFPYDAMATINASVLSPEHLTGHTIGTA